MSLIKQGCWWVEVLGVAMHYIQDMGQDDNPVWALLNKSDFG